MSNYTYTKYWTKRAGRITPGWEKPARGTRAWKGCQVRYGGRPVPVAADRHPHQQPHAEWRSRTSISGAMRSGYRPDQAILNLTAVKPSISDTYDAPLPKNAGEKPKCDRKRSRQRKAGVARRITTYYSLLEIYTV